MDEQIVQQIFDELLSSLEPLDTRTAALLQFLKAKGIATDEELALYLEQAGNASNVRWRAARVRIRSLISSALKPTEQPSAQPAETQPTNTAEKVTESAAETNQKTARQEQSEQERQAAPANDANSKPEEPVPTVAEKGEGKKEGKPAKSDQPPKKEDTKAAPKENAA